MTDPLLLRESEVCALLAVDRKTLWRLHRAGRLPRVPVGKRGFRYRRSDVLAFVNDGIVTPVARFGRGRGR